MSDSGDRYRFDFSADGLTVLRAYEQDDDGTYDRDDLDPGESYTLYGNAILHVEGSGSDAEWGIYVQEPGANTWIEAVDGHGTLDPTLIPSILSRLGVDDGEDDDDDEEEDEDEDDDGGIIGVIAIASCLTTAGPYRNCGRSRTTGAKSVSGFRPTKPTAILAITW